MKKTIQVRIDEGDIVKLKDEAEKKGHTVSSIVRFLVKKFLD